MKAAPLASHCAPGAPATRRWLAFLLLTALSYGSVFVAVRGTGDLAPSLARNIVSLLLTALLFRPLLRTLARRRDKAASGLHLLAAPAFSLLWSWLLSLSAGVLRSGSGTDFSVSPLLTGPAAEWQLLQGLFVYAALAGWSAADEARAELARLSAPQPAPPPSAARAASPLLVRSDDGIVAPDTEDLCALLGADDYTEVRSRHGTRLVGTTLREFEDLLDPRTFVRVHRSTIVNMAFVERAEPAGGGRMILHLRDGQSLQASRNGARLLRERLL
jgi:hypothetical protein